MATTLSGRPLLSLSRSLNIGTLSSRDMSVNDIRRHPRFTDFGKQSLLKTSPFKQLKEYLIGSRLKMQHEEGFKTAFFVFR